MRAEVVRLPNIFDPSLREWAELRRPLRIRRLVPPGRPCVVILNGRILPRAAWRRRLRDGDRAVIRVLPANDGSNPLRLVLSLALIAFAPWAAGALLGPAAGTVLFGSFTLGQATALGLYMAGSALINALLPPPAPARLPEASPTYSLQAQGNAARLGAPVPVHYGRLLCYPDLAAQPYVEYAGNEQYLFQLLCLGAGAYDIEEMRIEDTPLDAFGEVEVEIAGPGEPVTLFPTAVVTSVEVSGQTLRGRASGSWARSGTTITVTETGHLRAPGQAVHLEFTTGGGPNGVYTIATVPDDDSFTVTAASGSGSGEVLIRTVLGGATGFTASAPETVAHRLGIDLVMPRGLFAAGSGGIGTRSLSVRIEAQRIDDLGAPLGGWTLLGEETIEDATVTPQRRTVLYNAPAPGRWRVRAWRLDAASTAAGDGHEVVWAGLRAYLAEPQERPPVTLIAIRMRASNSLSAQASRRIAVLATRRLPVWTGSAWTAPQPTRSIAWALADAARNPDYGARLPDWRLDLAGLAALDALWTARGDTFDGRFDTAGTWWEAAQKIARAGRARVFLQSGRLRIARDGPAAVPTQLFTMGAIVRGSFGIDIAMPRSDTADAVEAQIYDGTTWAPRTIRARLDGSPAGRPARIDLFGVTSSEQALRECHYHAAANRYRRTTIRFETEAEGLIATIGDLIAVQHSMPAWGQFAEVAAWDAADRRLTLAEPLDWSGSGHVIALTARDGGMLGPYACTRGATDAEAILAETPAETPFAGPDAARTRVSFGRGQQTHVLARVVQVTPRGPFRVAVDAVVEEPAVHAAETGRIPRALLPRRLPARLTRPQVEGLIARALPEDDRRIVVAWRPAPGAEIYQVEMAEIPEDGSEGGFVRVADTTAAEIFLPILRPERSRLRVRGIGIAAGDWAEADVGSLLSFFWRAAAAPFWTADADLFWRD